MIISTAMIFSKTPLTFCSVPFAVGVLEKIGTPLCCLFKILLTLQLIHLLGGIHF